MPSRPPIDRTIAQTYGDRGPYDSLFAPNDMGAGPVGPDGFGFGVGSRSFRDDMERPPTDNGLILQLDPALGMPGVGSQVTASPDEQRLKLARALLRL